MGEPTIEDMLQEALDFEKDALAYEAATVGPAPEEPTAEGEAGEIDTDTVPDDVLLFSNYGGGEDTKALPSTEQAPSFRGLEPSPGGGLDLEDASSLLRKARSMSANHSRSRSTASRSQERLPEESEMTPALSMSMPKTTAPDLASPGACVGEASGEESSLVGDPLPASVISESREEENSANNPPAGDPLSLGNPWGFAMTGDEPPAVPVQDPNSDPFAITIGRGASQQLIDAGPSKGGVAKSSSKPKAKGGKKEAGSRRSSREASLEGRASSSTSRGRQAPAGQAGSSGPGSRKSSSRSSEKVISQEQRRRSRSRGPSTHRSSKGSLHAAGSSGGSGEGGSTPFGIGRDGPSGKKSTRARRKSVVALTREMVQNHALPGELAGFPASPAKRRQLGLVDPSAANVANYSPQGKEHGYSHWGKNGEEGMVGGFQAPPEVREGMSDVISGFVAPLQGQIKRGDKKEKSVKSGAKREKREGKASRGERKDAFRPKCQLDPLPPIGRAA